MHVLSYWLIAVNIIAIVIILHTLVSLSVSASIRNTIEVAALSAVPAWCGKHTDTYPE